MRRSRRRFDSIRFDSIRSRQKNDLAPFLSRFARFDVLAPSRARVSRVVESSRRRGVPPPTPRPKTHESTYMAYNSTRIRETTRFLPHRYDASSASSSVYNPQFPPSHVFGHTETVVHDRRPNATRLQIVAAHSRSFVRSIVRTRRSRRRPSLFSVLARSSRQRASTTRKAASSSSWSSRSNDHETERRARET